MIRKKKHFLLFGLIFCFIIGMLIKIPVEKTKENIIYEISSKSGKENTEINSEDNYVIIYNTVFLPMNETFDKIMPNKYQDQENFETNYNGQQIKFEFDNKIVELINENDEENNNTQIEIEEVNKEKYIPVYLISELPGITVKINGKEVYKEKKYINSIDAIKKNDNNKIVIYHTQEEKEKKDDNNYFGEQYGAAWREEALKRIEKYRKKDAKIIIRNSNGDKINAKININMTSNEFKFGTSIPFNYQKNENNYELINKKYFNLIETENGIKWPVTEVRGLTIPKQIISYAKENKMNLRGHLLYADTNWGEVKKIVQNSDDSADSFEKINQEYLSKKISKNVASARMKRLKEEYKEIIYNRFDYILDELNDIHEWDCVNSPDMNKYFKYYLFEENAIWDNSFENREIRWDHFYDNYEEYNKFLAECFDRVREKRPNDILVININYMNGSNSSTEYVINVIKDINKFTNNINMIGIQNHIQTYSYSPQSYYNQINKICNETGIDNCEITEYDNYVKDKKDSVKADYLRDTMISAYSNKKMKEFTMWVFNSDEYYTEEERKEYYNIVEKWLNFSNIVDNTSTYSNRLYKGTYEATITLPNGKSQVVNFDVSDASNDTIEVVFDSKLQNISIKEEPKTEYYKNDKIDLTTGSIIANYDDGTSKEIKLTDNDIKILNFDTIDNGKKTLTIQYNGCNTSYDINVKENIKEDVNKIINENNIIKNKYASVYRNENVEKQYNNLLNYLNETSQNQDENSLELLNKIYVEQLNLARTIVDEYNKNNITIKSTDYEEIIKQIMDISDDYKDLYKLYISEDNLSNKEAEDKINNVINRYNDNTDIDLSKETDLINKLKELYGSLSSNDDITLNYLNKQRISKTCEIVSLMLENDIKNVANSECRKITITSDSGLGNYTNHDETITVNLPKKAKVTSDNGASSFIFKENGTKEIKINNRGYDYTYRIVVSNINKQAPEIKTNSGQDVKIDVSEDNLKEIKIEKDGEETKAKIGQVISVPGIYKITATDKAGNSSNKEIIVYKNYTNEQNSQVKYITIKSKTKVKDVRENTDYSITKNSKIIAALKSANSNSNNIDESYISTGDVLKDGNNEYTFVVIGDLSGNGQVVVGDIIRLRKNIVGITDLSKLQELAADTNLDGKVDILDLVEERKIMVGVK